MKGKLREEVKKFYGSIAVSSGACCCSSSCCGDKGISSGLYPREFTESIPDEAVNASLGCANPIAEAEIREGETVLDLGSGGGIDALIAAGYVGSSGQVYGLDMTDEMLTLANRNKERAGAHNVHFIKGYIEEIPLGNDVVDVIISNCVINLCESKEKAAAEAHRVMKKGGRFVVADVINIKPVPEHLKNDTALWAGCLTGAISSSEYEKVLAGAGFRDIEIKTVSIYGREALGDVAPELEGAYAGAIVRAYK